MCCFPISSVSVPKLGLKIVLWEWEWVHYIGSIKSCRGSLITNEIPKKKKKDRARELGIEEKGVRLITIKLI